MPPRAPRRGPGARPPPSRGPDPARPAARARPAAGSRPRRGPAPTGRGSCLLQDGKRAEQGRRGVLLVVHAGLVVPEPGPVLARVVVVSLAGHEDPGHAPQIRHELARRAPEAV